MADTTAAAAQSSAYLAAQTASLESQTPVAPSSARAAQVPLQNFDLPVFPQEAFTSGLTSLILTSDIKLDEYTSLLDQAFSIPPLPPSITSLTLELFSLGYPPAFLSELGKALPNLKALTLYSQLFGGTTEHSRDDAVAFLKSQKGLREIHFLDVFTSPGLMGRLAESLGDDVKFVELSYTFRHSDPVGFRGSLPVTELENLVRKGLVALTVGIVAPDVTPDEEDREGTEVGIVPVVQKDGKGLVERLKGGDGDELVMLDITMVEVGVEDVKSILEKCKKLKVLSVSVGLVTGWDEVFEGLKKDLAGLEMLELVGVPGEGLVDKLTAGEQGAGQLTAEMLTKVSEVCPELSSVKTSILRTKGEHWMRESGGSWKKQA
ncbi:uncharacterized protein BP5553_04312 [Venustampulla echinocandica]|uniref:Uncharacterized protein n=1 Tax=Venustampulla echinocandica TaxID=2656787 RepID=A0A370TWR9_9HELO|nr:uncharacterized protein BP5553_04312 [Venustampulla echinocandica]RDL39972.1 hypothetical protein BP5553_04312 [Venustampulla echinocandica]